MNDISATLFSPLATPAWVFIGGVLTKLIDGWMKRDQTKADTQQSAVSGYNMLNQSLQASLEAMSKELGRLRSEHREDAERYEARIKSMGQEAAQAAARYEARIESLETEITRLQMLLLDHTLPSDDPAKMAGREPLLLTNQGIPHA